MTDLNDLARKYDACQNPKPKKDYGWIMPIVAVLITIALAGCFYHFYWKPNFQTETKKQHPTQEQIALDALLIKLHDAALKEGDILPQSATLEAINFWGQPDGLKIGEKKLLFAFRLKNATDKNLTLHSLNLIFSHRVSDCFSSLQLHLINNQGLRSGKSVGLSSEMTELNTQTLGFLLRDNIAINKPPEDFVVPPGSCDTILALSGTLKSAPNIPKEMEMMLNANDLIAIDDKNNLYGNSLANRLTFTLGK